MDTAPEETVSAERSYFVGFDAAWMLLLAAVIGLNLYVSWHEVSQALRTEDTRQNASALIDELGKVAKGRQASSAGVGACGVQSIWTQCRESLMAARAESSRPIQNLLRPDAAVFASVCDRTVPKSLGAIVVERGSPKAADPTNLIYEAISDAQPLNNAVALRISVCGRLFNKMVMGDLTL